LNGGLLLTLSDIYKDIHCFGIEHLVPLTSVKTREDQERFKEQGIQAGYLLSEFQQEHPNIDPETIYFGNGFSPFLYWNRKENIMFQIPGVVNGRDYLPLRENDTIEHDIEARFDYVKQSYAKHIYYVIFDMLNNTLSMGFFNTLVMQDFIPKAYLYSAFLCGYIRQDYGIFSLTQSSLQKIINSKTETERRITKKHMLNLPDEIVIYRGEGDSSSKLEDAISWTTNINVANFFAARRSKSGRIYSTTVNKKDVIEYITDNNEYEILIHLNRIKNIKTMELYTYDNIVARIENISDLYRTYKFILKREIKFSNALTEGHDKSHSMRVLFLALLFCNLEDISFTDMQRIATASIYHDSRRTHDGIDDNHGGIAAE
jgi:hypothetical protein